MPPPRFAHTAVSYWLHRVGRNTVPLRFGGRDIRSMRFRPFQRLDGSNLEVSRTVLKGAFTANLAGGEALRDPLIAELVQALPVVEHVFAALSHARSDALRGLGDPMT